MEGAGTLSIMGHDLHTVVFHVIIVICLILIAYSQVKIAHMSSGFVGGDMLSYAIDTSASNGPGAQSNFVGASEAPVFWNMGSARETSQALAQAAAQNAADAAKAGGKFSDFTGGVSSFAGPEEYRPIPYVPLGTPYGI